ncbi:MAG: molybdenum cofactor biosynthesis protein MoaE [Deltaproteobacteria bacterium]|nr:molybdenum cofactor biosynthesis protein MoaE [Deltaproteobacteria bacterium]
MSRIDVRDAPLSLDEVVREVSHPGAGAVTTFLGVVRDQSEGRVVTRLDYSAYESMAKRQMEKIADGIERELPGVRVAAIHRVGSLVVGDAAIVCAASAPHRGEAFAACRLLIDRIKAEVPIWKRELGPDGAEWVGWVDARCSADHGHDHGHGHGHGHGHDRGH